MLRTEFKRGFLKSAYNLTQLIRHFEDGALPQRWGHSLKNKLVAQLQQNPPLSESVLELDASAFNLSSIALLREQRPVVFRGAAAAWGCSARWSIEWLHSSFGEDIVLDVDRFALRRIRHVLSGSLAGTVDYVRFYSLLQRHPELLSDIDLVGLLRFAGPRTIDQGFQCFVGNSRASTTHLHNANDSNLFIQVKGRKKWSFIGSQYTPLIDPPPVLAEYRAVDLQRTHFDPFAPDYGSFPEFCNVPVCEVTLDAGDILYNPPYVWHAVRNLSDDSLAVAYRWLAPQVCARFEPAYFLMDLTARHPPIWKSIGYTRRDFSLVFIEQFPKIKKSVLFEEYLAQVTQHYGDYLHRMQQAKHTAGISVKAKS